MKTRRTYYRVESSMKYGDKDLVHWYKEADFDTLKDARAAATVSGSHSPSRIVRIVENAIEQYDWPRDVDGRVITGSDGVAGRKQRVDVADDAV